MTTPRVLVSDKLSPTAVQIFKDRGIDVDYQPDLGKDKEAFLAAIADYDGLAILTEWLDWAFAIEKASLKQAA